MSSNFPEPLGANTITTVDKIASEEKVRANPAHTTYLHARHATPDTDNMRASHRAKRAFLRWMMMVVLASSLARFSRSAFHLPSTLLSSSTVLGARSKPLLLLRRQASIRENVSCFHHHAHYLLFSGRHLRSVVEQLDVPRKVSDCIRSNTEHNTFPRPILARYPNIL
jgi:hypothetical protein